MSLPRTLSLFAVAACLPRRLALKTEPLRDACGGKDEKRSTRCTPRLSLDVSTPCRLSGRVETAEGTRRFSLEAARQMTDTQASWQPRGVGHPWWRHLEHDRSRVIFDHDEHGRQNNGLEPDRFGCQKRSGSSQAQPSWLSAAVPANRSRNAPGLQLHARRSLAHAPKRRPRARCLDCRTPEDARMPAPYPP